MPALSLRYDHCSLRKPRYLNKLAIETVAREARAQLLPPGADALTLAQLNAAKSAFADADVVLCQLEIPLPIVEAAARMAAALGKPILLNPAPAVTQPEALLDRVTLLTPNEHELALVYAEDSGDWKATLLARPQRILMTHGAAGAWFADADGQLHHQPAFPVDAVDTTGAGDTFNGAIAAFWGLPMADIARLACAAGALSVTRSGAQSGMPTRAQLESFLSERS